MAEEYSIQEALNRSEKFYWNTEHLKFILENDRETFFNLQILHDDAVEFYKNNCYQELSDRDKFDQVFRELFRVFNRKELEMQIYYKLEPELPEICKFLTLCTFLHTSKRIKGKSISDFVSEKSPLKFNYSDSINYRSVTLKNTEAERLRKYRMRLLRQGKVYIKNQQWNAISQDSVYEWKFFYDLEKESPDVQNTFKRLKNLYNDILKAIPSRLDKNYESRVQIAYEKFLSKLKKLQYKDYLELQQVILSRIGHDSDEAKKYYGINLYRLERRMHPYIITHEIKQLNQCKSNAEIAISLIKIAALEDICFPGIYKIFFDASPGFTNLFAEIFSIHNARFVIETCLVLDELVERNCFGKAWEDLFLKITNEMATTVLYDPKEIDFSAVDGSQNDSQKNFLRVLHASVAAELADFNLCVNLLHGVE